MAVPRKTRQVAVWSLYVAVNDALMVHDIFTLLSVIVVIHGMACIFSIGSRFMVMIAFSSTACHVVFIGTLR